MAKIYSVVSNKGGILKSTLCVNISAELSKKSRTVIVDTDGQSDVAATFGVKNSDIKFTLFDCLTKNIDINETIINVGEYLDIIPAGKGMNSFIKKDGSSVVDLKNAIDTLKDKYKFIFIDTAPSMNFATLQAMVASDEIIIPFQAEGYGMVSIVDTIKAIQEVKKSVNPRLKINSIVERNMIQDLKYIKIS